MNKSKKVKIDLTSYEEIKDIPGYYINKEGLIWSSLTDKHIGSIQKIENKYYPTTHHVVGFKTPEGRVTKNILRLLWTQFNGVIPRNMSVVNKPGKEGSIKLEDLRLVTTTTRKIMNGREHDVDIFNVIHVKNLKTGMKITFSNIGEFIKLLDSNKKGRNYTEYDTMRAHKFDEFVQVEDYIVLNPFYKHYNPTEIKWPEVGEARVIKTAKGRSNVKNIITGEVTVIDVLKPYVEDMGVNVYSKIIYHLTKGRSVILSGKNVVLFRTEKIDDENIIVM